MSFEEMGCCGAYCGSCPVLKSGACKGCKNGYVRFFALADKWINAYGKYK